MTNNDPLTLGDLDEIQARADAATAEPWALHFADKYTARVGIDWSSSPTSLTGTLDRKNAEFIAHSRTDVPILIAEIKRLRALL